MRATLLIGAIAGLSLVATACGDDTDGTAATAPASVVATSGEDPTSATDGSTPTSTTPSTAEPTDGSGDAADEPGDVPDAIVSLSPTATEMLYAIGAGDQVIAVDDFSTYPPEASAKMAGVSAFEPNVEAIAGLEPDLILTDGTNLQLLEQLDTLDIAHWEGPAAISFSDVYTQIEQLGALTGHVGEAAEVVSGIETELAEIQADLPELAEPLTYYHELDGSYFSATSDTFIGTVYGQLGLRNIADLVETSGGPYPQLNAEFIIDADPDLIFLACTKYCGETAESVAARPGWGDMRAVVNGGVIELDDDIASRWGPRVVEYLRTAADAVAAAAEREPAG